MPSQPLGSDHTSARGRAPHDKVRREKANIKQFLATACHSVTIPLTYSMHVHAGGDLELIV